jgi:hypothetical protein
VTHFHTVPFLKRVICDCFVGVCLAFIATTRFGFRLFHSFILFSHAEESFVKNLITSPSAQALLPPALLYEKKDAIIVDGVPYSAHKDPGKFVQVKKQVKYFIVDTDGTVYGYNERV